MKLVKKSTATKISVVAYLASDHITEATGKTLVTDLRKEGGVWADAAGLTVTEKAHGEYEIDLSAGNTDTLGLGVVRITSGDSSIDTDFIYFQVVEELPGLLKSTYDFAKGTAAPTESYAAAGAVPTPIQALLMILQTLTERSFSSTTGTVKKRDQSTTAFTQTVNSSSAPTSVTQAT